MAKTPSEAEGARQVEAVDGCGRNRNIRREPRQIDDVPANGPRPLAKAARDENRSSAGEASGAQDGGRAESASRRRLMRKPAPRRRRTERRQPSEIQTGAASTERTQSAAAEAPPGLALEAPPLATARAQPAGANAPYPMPDAEALAHNIARAIEAGRQGAGRLSGAPAERRDQGDGRRRHRRNGALDRPSGRILHGRSPAGVRGANDAHQAIRRPLGFDPAAPAGRTGAAGRRA